MTTVRQASTQVFQTLQRNTDDYKYQFTSTVARSTKTTQKANALLQRRRQQRREMTGYPKSQSFSSQYPLTKKEGLLFNGPPSLNTTPISSYSSSNSFEYHGSNDAGIDHHYINNNRNSSSDSREWEKDKLFSSPEEVVEKSIGYNHFNNNNDHTINNNPPPSFIGTEFTITEDDDIDMIHDLD